MAPVIRLRVVLVPTPSVLLYFFAALTFAHRAFCADAIFLRAAADTLRCGLTPLFPETLPAAFSALIFAQRARVAAAIRFLPAADIWRVGRAVVSTLPSPNSDRTCCSLEISARTSLTIFSTLNVFLIVARCDRTG